MNQDGLRFVKVLRAMAAITRFELTADVVELYCTAIENSIGYERGAEALLRLIKSAKRWPTISDIEAEAGEVTLNDEQLGRDIAAQIRRAVTLCGHTRTPPIETVLSPIALRVVEEMGGWETFCVFENWDDFEMFLVQTREYAKIVAQKAAGNLAALPPPKEDVKALPLSEVLADVGAKRGAQDLMARFAELTKEKE